MKKYFILVLLSLLVGYTAITDHWFVDERDIYFPITKEQLRVKKKYADKHLSNPRAQ